MRIFPNEDSVIRLIGTLLIENHEKWITKKKYFVINEYFEEKKKKKSNKKNCLKSNERNLQTNLDLTYYYRLV